MPDVIAFFLAISQQRKHLAIPRTFLAGTMFCAAGVAQDAAKEARKREVAKVKTYWDVEKQDYALKQ